MASLTRSERRSDDSPDLRFLSSPRHSHEHRPRSVVGPPAGAPLTRSRPAVFQHSNSNSGRATPAGRTKRGLDASERDLDALKPKRARIAVEILAKQRPVIGPDNVRVQPPRARPSGGAVGAETVVKPPQVPPAAEQQQPQHQQPRQQNIQPPQSTSSSAADVKEQNQFTAPTKHQEKVRKGIKHELDRLQPQPTDTSAPSGRKLRSQEATRFKSDLSAYFPDYDEIVGNDPKETHLLDLETPIIIVDSARKGTIGSASQSASLNYYPVRGYGDALFTDVVDCQRIDFSFLESQFKNKTLEDPLPDSTFEGVHKRAERLERSIRNTEKGRAYHEKDQIVRLLEGLQGHDWLRIMGISGITDSRKKSFESAREYFIKGCQAILDKFRNWTLEEKRRKQEKDRAIAEEAERAANDGSGDQEEEGDEHTSHAENVNDSSMAEEDTSSAGTSDVSSPAKQLREEALAHSRANKARSLKRPRAASKAVAAPPPKPPEPPKEFTSFFSKKYERDGALNRHRRAGRKVLAWGLPVPDFQQTDFDLPETYRDEETMRTRARKKRKDKRSSRV